jgi:hypothetical protein
MRVRDLQQYLEKFTLGQKGTAVSDCPIFIETQNGHLEEIRKIEIQENLVIGHPQAGRMVLKTENVSMIRSQTFKQS